MSEVWKPVVGYEGYYEVSNLGHVRSVERDVPDSRGYMQHHKGRIRKSFLRTGYLRVSLCRNSKMKNLEISRLVCQAFLPEYSEELTVDHINGNTLDNRLENLQCLSHRANIQKAWTDGTNDKKKRPITLKRISDGEVFQFESISEAARVLNVTRISIRRAKQNNKEVKGYIIL